MSPWTVSCLGNYTNRQEQGLERGKTGQGSEIINEYKGPDQWDI